MEKNKIIGLIKISEYIDSNSSTTKQNTWIVPMAIWNNKLHRYKTIKDEEDRFEMFPNNGTIYIYQATAEQWGNDSLITCNYSESNSYHRDGKYSCKFNADTNSVEDYIDLYQIIDVSTPVSLLSGYITQEELNEYLTIVDTKFFEVTEENPKFFLRMNIDKTSFRLYGPFEISGKNIIPHYQQDVTSRSVNEYDYDKEDFKSELITNEGKTFLINDGGWAITARRKIDCMTDEQLRLWFIDKLIGTLHADKNYEELVDFFKNNKDGTQEPLSRIRMRRVQERLDGLELTYGEIKEILTTKTGLPLLSELQKSLDSNLEKFKEEIVGQSKKELKTINSSITNSENELEKIDALLEERLKEAEAKKVDIDTINANYDSIIAAVRLSCSVLQSSATSINNQIVTEHKFNPDDYVSFKKTGTEITSIEPNSLLKMSFSNILSKKACFIPNLSIAFNYAKIIGNSRVFVIHIEHDWLHYDDFCKHYLIDIWEYAHNHKDENIILVLDCINITFIEGGLKPLLDVINNQNPYLLYTKLTFPHNLKIMATVVRANLENDERIGLKINPTLFNNWGAYFEPEYNGFLKEDILIENTDGFYAPDVLYNALDETDCSEIKQKYYDF